jgi:hypothetical protein
MSNVEGNMHEIFVNKLREKKRKKKKERKKEEESDMGHQA